MSANMKLDHQVGTLSLGWCMILFGALFAVVMAGLLSFGFERNLFAEGWRHLVQTADRMPLLPQATQAATRMLQPRAAAIRKCIVKGKVVYSNLECEPTLAGPAGTRQPD